MEELEPNLLIWILELLLICDWTLEMAASVDLAAQNPLFEVIFAVYFKANSSVENYKFMALMLRGNYELKI